jgi:hypothetical protein
VALAFLAVAAPRPAGAFPTYSRKYATSCGTCHTIYPKLTAFGEAFRRNGYRFPGVVDSDYIKQEIVPMGQDAAKRDFPNSTWPSYITSPPPFGFVGTFRVTTHPDEKSAAAVKDNGTRVSLDQLGTSGTIFASGNIDDSFTYLALVGVSATATTLDQSLLVWNDVVGPRHLASLSIGNSYPTLTPFGRGSSYTGRLTSGSSLGTFYGWTGAAFRPTAKYNLVELNGILGGRFEYGAGVAAGTHDTVGVHPPGNFYGHVAAKLGGMRLDGEGDTVASNPLKPWQETSATIWGYAYRSNTDFISKAKGTGAQPVPPADIMATDLATSLGGGLRLQYASAELTVGGLWEDHSHITSVLGPDSLPLPAKQVSTYGELSYIIYPWLVPAVRVERLTVSPRDTASSTATRYQVALATQPRTNMKLSVTASMEQTDGPPTSGGDWSKLSGDGFNQPKTVTTAVPIEVSVVTITASFGF